MPHSDLQSRVFFFTSRLTTFGGRFRKLEVEVRHLAFVREHQGHDAGELAGTFVQIFSAAASSAYLIWDRVRSPIYIHLVTTRRRRRTSAGDYERHPGSQR